MRGTITPLRPLDRITEAVAAYGLIPTKTTINWFTREADVLFEALDEMTEEERRTLDSAIGDDMLLPHFKAWKGAR